VARRVGARAVAALRRRAGRSAAGTATDSAPAAPEPPVRYRVIVEAPSPVSEAVAAGGDLIRWQGYADMTRDLLHR